MAGPHEVELAVRTADTIWLLTPDRQLRVGAPDCVAGAGGGDAFEAIVSALRPANQAINVGVVAP